MLSRGTNKIHKLTREWQKVANFTDGIALQALNAPINLVFTSTDVAPNDKTNGFIVEQNADYSRPSGGQPAAFVWIRAYTPGDRGAICHISWEA